MNAKKKAITICLLAMTLLMSGCGPGQLPEPTEDSEVNANNPTEAAPSEAPPKSPSYSPNSALTPVLFFTDITSGPQSGGQDNLGAFITIYGEGFGEAR